MSCVTRVSTKTIKFCKNANFPPLDQVFSIKSGSRYLILWICKFMHNLSICLYLQVPSAPGAPLLCQ